MRLRSRSIGLGSVTGRILPSRTDSVSQCARQANVLTPIFSATAVEPELVQSAAEAGRVVAAVRPVMGPG
jgi:hypothetical protein